MNYAGDQSSASSMIRAAGRQATLQYDTFATENVVTDLPDAPTTTNVQVWMVAFPLKGNFSDSYQPSLQVRQRSRKFLIDARGMMVAPSEGMRVIGWEGKDWRIVACTPLDPNGTGLAIVYTGVMEL